MSESSQAPELEQVTDTAPDASFSIFEMGVLILAVLSVFLWPGLYVASEATARILELSDYAVSAIFLVKFVMDLLKAPSKRRFMRWGWIDLIASMPVLPVLHGLRGCFEKGHGAGKGGSGVGFPYLTSGCTPAPPAIPYRGAPCHVNPTPVI